MGKFMLVIYIEHFALMSLSFIPASVLRTISAADVLVYFSTIALYLWDVPIPPTLAALLTSVYGIVFLVAAASYMLLYMKPITGIVSIALTYRIYQLSLKNTPYTAIEPIPQFKLRGQPLEYTTPVPSISVQADPTLEEYIVAQNAPIGEESPIYAVQSIPANTYSSEYRPLNAKQTFTGIAI
jgi:hypothetical protein